MAKNDFKPFAIGEFSNVLSQEDYEALPAVGAGYNTGIAKSEQLNKTWRQASVMASVLGNFIGEQSGDDVLDDGDLNKLKLSLEKAIRQYLAGAEVDDRYVLKTQKVNGKDLSDNIELSASDVDALPITGGNLLGSVNALGSVGAQGGAFLIRNAQGVQIASISAGSDGAITVYSDVSGRSFGFDSFGNFTTAAGAFVCELGQRVYSPNNKPDELHVDGDSWWSQDSSGKITQGGVVNRSANSNPVSFSKPFPNAVLSIQLTLRDVTSSGGSTDNIIAQNATNSGFTTWMNANELSAYWMAVGY
ncbi:gp53-like domain-containing protein [Serratia bockelmannii]|uniref:gp53-like domain-containing protein n=1 Tax=Serratia bockelmannii TaxID=2703793 RepID=UPI00313ABB6F